MPTTIPIAGKAQSERDLAPGRGAGAIPAPRSIEVLPQRARPGDGLVILFFAGVLSLAIVVIGGASYFAVTAGQGVLW